MQPGVGVAVGQDWGAVSRAGTAAGVSGEYRGVLVRLVGHPHLSLPSPALDLPPPLSLDLQYPHSLKLSMETVR